MIVIVAMHAVKFRRSRVVILVICLIAVSSVGYWLMYLTSRPPSRLSQLHSYMDKYHGHSHGHGDDHGHGQGPDYGHDDGRSHHHGHSRSHRDGDGHSKDNGHDHGHSHEHGHGHSHGEKSSFAEERPGLNNNPQHHKDDDYDHFYRNEARNSNRQKEVENVHADDQQNGERGMAGGDDRYDYSDEDDTVDHIQPGLKNNDAAAPDDNDNPESQVEKLRQDEPKGNELPAVHDDDDYAYDDDDDDDDKNLPKKVDTQSSLNNKRKVSSVDREYDVRMIPPKHDLSITLCLQYARFY